MSRFPAARWRARRSALVLVTGAAAGAAAGAFVAAVIHALAGRSLGGLETAAAGVVLTGTPLAALLPWSAIALAAARYPEVARSVPAAGVLWALAAAAVVLLLAAPLVR